MSVSSWVLSASDQLLAVLVGADDDGAAVEPAVDGPSRVPSSAAAAARRPAPQGRTKKNADSQSRETSPPSLTRKDTPMNSRNTKAHDEIIRVIWRSWPRKICTW